MLTPSELRGIRQALSNADDHKIRRVVALLDQMPGTTGAHAILDPLRPRLGILRPPRPLRFERLLFIPLDPLIVPAANWRPGAASIPRSALTSIGQTVLTALAGEAAWIEATIAGRDTGDEAVIETAGNWLWPRAAAILAAPPPPIGWDRTALPMAVYTALARGIGAALDRTGRLHDLARQAAIGAQEPDDNAVLSILEGLSADQPEGLGMVVALLLRRLPNAALQLQHLIDSSKGSAQSAALRHAVDKAIDRTLVDMEGPAGFDAAIRDASLRCVGQEVQRIVTLLRDIDSEPDLARHRSRLKSIRAKLHQACRARFGAGLEQGIAAPLAIATEPVTGVAQTDMETSARELRILHMAARKIGEPAVYDTLLDQATEIVRVASEAGVLTPMRQCRLVEILAGPEAAEALLALSR